MADTPAIRTPQGVVRFKSQDAFASYLQDSGLVATPRVAVGDGMMSVLTGVGGSMDGAANLSYFVRQYSDVQIENALRSSWILSKIHREPPRDVVSAWREWSADPQQITAIEREERRIGLRQKIEDAMVWARAYGGAAIMLGVNGDDPAAPLNINTVRRGSLRYAHVLTKSQIQIPNLVLDPGSDLYLQPTEYLINSGNGQQVRVHPTRIVRFLGQRLPENLMMQNGGWADPLLYTIETAAMQSDAVQAAFAAVAAKAREDTVSIPGLTSIASTTEGEEMLKKRILVSAAFRSMFNIQMLDGGRDGKDAEAWETFQPVLSGMKDVMLTFLQFACAAGSFPMTKFAGMSPGGLSSTGESDLEIYHQTLTAGRELDLRPRLEQIDEILIRSALGERPEEIYFTFSPLKIDSEKTLAETAKLRAETSAIYSDTGLVPPEVMQQSVKGQLIESGEYPGIEAAYADYSAGALEPIAEAEASNDNDRSTLTAALLAQGMAANDAVRLSDAAPRPLYVMRRVLNADEIQAWMTEQGLGKLQPEPHVTIAFSRTPVDWLKMGTSWADKDGDGTGKLEITAGGPRLVEPLGDRTAVLMFSSTDLQWRHREMVEAGASWDFDDYTPHISLTGEEVDLSGVEPYRGRIILGMEIFKELDA